MQRVVGLRVDSDDLVGRENGFLAIRRLRLRNVREDGTLSAQYLCDFIARPYGLDAIIVVVWARLAGGVQVLVREGLRPPLAFGREPDRQTIPDTRTYLRLTELVAGILEEGDRGEDGLRRRAAAEVLEEGGFRVRAEDVVLLGAGAFPSPGAMAEKFYFAAVEVDPATQEPLAGDGSPMEEGAETRWLALDDAIAACVRGDIEDLKTEMGLRRFRDTVGR
jgi:ADP-ribose pyrophosphatase